MPTMIEIFVVLATLAGILLIPRFVNGFAFVVAVVIAGIYKVVQPVKHRYDVHCHRRKRRKRTGF